VPPHTPPGPHRLRRHPDREQSPAGFWRQVEFRVGVEHLPVELAEPWPRLDAQLVDLRAPGVLVGGQCLGPLPAPVPGEHQLIPQPLRPHRA
jgi:hypothetical protein